MGRTSHSNYTNFPANSCFVQFLERKKERKGFNRQFSVVFEAVFFYPQPLSECHGMSIRLNVTSNGFCILKNSLNFSNSSFTIRTTLLHP